MSMIWRSRLLSWVCSRSPINTSVVTLYAKLFAWIRGFVKHFSGCNFAPNPVDETLLIEYF
jgi:hypothetical protein